MESNEIEAMKNSFKTLIDKRKEMLNDPYVIKLQEKVKKIREEAIDNNENLLKIAEQAFKRNDIDYFYAEDDKEAREIIYKIIEEEGETVIAKSKSNTLGEVGISSFLKSKGIEVVETDLGDRILQLKETDNKPAHPTGPASHLNVVQIADIVNKANGANVKSIPEEIMEFVREDVKGRIKKSKVALSGANSVASEDGSLVFIHNEGNITLLTLMKTHIVLVGIDKLIETVEDAITIAKLETIYATGSKITSYINVVSGPSKTADIEKKLIKNMYASERVVVILLDNGRKEARKNIKECLNCIGCGSCIVTCPVYNIIGNDFGYNNYLGGRGVAMSRFIENSQVSYDCGLYKCTLCGLCTLSCPVSISTNDAIEKIRTKSQKEGKTPKQHQHIKEKIKEKNSPY